jgi:hypothetical protein
MNVRSAARQLQLKSNSGNLPIFKVAEFEGFHKEVWYSQQAITNILSLSCYKQEFDVSYDREDFIVHHTKQGYTGMMFKPHSSGLHVYDQEDSWGYASYNFIQAVQENMLMFTKHQIVNADLARNLQAGMAYPSIKDLKWVVQSNQIKDCPVSAQDVNVALKIWGPSVALLKDKTVCCTPLVVVQDIVEVPKEIQENHKQVTLMIVIFFVNVVPYFVTLSLQILFLSVTHMTNRKIITIFKALKTMQNYYLRRGFKILFIKGDGEFKPIEVMVCVDSASGGLRSFSIGLAQRCRLVPPLDT